MDIKTALNRAGIKLRAKKINSADWDAELLLGSVLRQSKEFVISHRDDRLTSGQRKKFERLIARRSKHEPLAYILKHKEFFGLDFLVDKNVLIPRPETEILVEYAINFAAASGKKKLTIADIGTGSGCIAVCLKKYLPQSAVTALDKSAKALAVAKKNANRHQVRIKFKLGNLLFPLNKIKYDIIVANLPYLDDNSAKAINKYQTNELKYEPAIALFCGRKGLELYEKLFHQINQLEYQPGLILGEIDPRQSIRIKTLVKKYFPAWQGRIIKDFSGFDRLLIIQRDL